ncbi:hypothetical protein BS47DRAFT_1197575 [Hydnum rufescens UP504]|uniref:Uncharacterized protein n=1 Tax=Hydnum rufescens UP504 TaxID=1448309 RepID=A0A9P6AT30_9AGAM|nr:hypothetical protein BS47DRAFT_1197575 [Hydnum rufescens UP504]
MISWNGRDRNTPPPPCTPKSERFEPYSCSGSLEVCIMSMCSSHSVTERSKKVGSGQREPPISTSSQAKPVKAAIIDAIVGGAVLRQTITFSRLKNDLTSSEDTEFVSIVVDTPLPSSSPRHIHLNELGTQFVQVSTTSNRYLLFTENCRWFARRNVLSIIQRLSEANIGFYTSWHTRRCPDKKIRDNLSSGPFSGWQLYGSKSTLIEAKDSLDHAWTLLAGKQYPEAVVNCQKAHTLLSSVRVPSSRRENLRSTASSLLAQGLYGIGEKHWREGLNEHRKACKTSHALRAEFEDHYFDTHNAFAAALLRMGKNQEASEIWTRLLGDQRAIHAKVQTIMSADGLAIFLFNYSLAWDKVPGYEPSRLEYLQEAISLRHDLFERRWDLYSKTYGAVLDEYAHVLDISNRSEEAFEASEKAVAVMRADYEHHPDSRSEFARCLYNHARYAARLEEWRKARLIGMKCVQHRRFLFMEDGGEYDVDLAKALENLGRYNVKMQRPNDGFDCLIEALQHRRSCYVASDRGHSSSKPLAKLLARMAEELDTAKDSGHTLPQSGAWNSDALRQEASKVSAGKKLEYAGRHHEHS